MTVLTPEWSALSPEAEAVRAELMCRGVLALDERADGEARRLVVASASEQRARTSVRELLGEAMAVEWLGPTVHRIVPARILGYWYYPVNTIYLSVEARADERVDGAYVAEDEGRVVVAAFKCSPQYGRRGPEEPGMERVLLDFHLAGRPVIDALAGEVLQPLDD